MVFSSLLFLTIFLPLFFIIYKLLPKATPVKNVFILLSSFVFYAWGEPKFVFIVFITTILDFYLVRAMSASAAPGRRKLFLVLSVLLNTGLLFYFKYFDFFADNLNVVLHKVFHFSEIKVIRIVLPIGISFFIFESITYAVDVYRNIQKPLDSFWKYQTYIIFFPKLIAGPIVRYHEIADQINSREKFERADYVLSGFIRFSIGLGKKIFIANAMASQADAVFSMNLDNMNTPQAWAGALAYTFQIYFDFSGYSDMAIGLGKMLGFTLPENFNNPYVSGSITEFWRRWHITLGRWMKNYLYIPLGGNKVGQQRLLLNLLIVFLVSGLWHGASWTFVFWGLYHGLFLVVERIFKLRENKSAFRYLNIFYAFVVVVVGWVFFRINTVTSGFIYVKKMFTFDFSHAFVFLYKPNFFPMLIVAALFSFSTLNKKILTFHDDVFLGTLSTKKYVYMTLLGFAIYFLSVVYLSGGEYNPFIYFKF